MAFFKVGDRVRVISADGGGGFYAFHVGRTGTVEIDDGGNLPLYVRFDGNEDYDWGRYEEVELLRSTGEADTQTVKEAIANVEAALATLKALVG